MDQDALCARFDDILDVALFEYRFAVDDDFVTFDRNHLAGIFVDEIFHPCLQHTGSKALAHHFFKVGLGDLDLFGQVEYL